jgi:hypothetical protein
LATRTKKTAPTADHKALALGEAKLKTSGLTLDDAKQLGMTCLGAQGTAGLHPAFKQLCSLRLDYLDHHGQPLPDWPGAKPFYRLRYLETPTDFSAMTEKKQVRYVQEPNTAPVAYYPGNQDWTDLVGDVNQPLILTEGELKAAKACKEGFPTIGLGGVYNWRSHKLGLTWLPSLDPIQWLKRNVYICFDSDYKTNPMVCAALRELAEELHRRGSFVHLISLPQLHGFEKVGLDDFLVHAGPSSNQMFRQLLAEAEPLGLTKPLWSLNDKYVYVQDPGLIVDQGTRFKASPGAFKEHLQAPLNYQERSLKQDGSVSFKAVSAAAAWLKWPLRTEVTKLTYQPGAERFIQDPRPLFNIWPGWGVQPAEDDVSPFLELVKHIFTNAEPEAMQWFLRWCAYPLQHPGTKLFSSSVLHGIRHGTGKSLIGYTLGRIYGQNFTEISQMDLHNSFNEWAEGKQFVMGDDVTGSNKRADADFLKKLITQRELRVNGKYVPTYVVPDCINYFFTANHPDSFFLEDDDRRFFIHEVRVGPMDEEFYMNYDLWLDTGGSAAVFHYLLHLDLGDFNPAAPAFKTAAKERMIANVQSDLAGWVRQLMATPDHVLRVGEVQVTKELFTSKELLQFYDPSGKTGTTANGLGRELARAGLHQICNGKPIRLTDGSQGRYYAVRNLDFWMTQAAPQAAVKHLEDWGMKQTGKKSAKY